MAQTNLTASQLPIGAIQSSMLSLAQFQSQNGLGWILADGSSASGSKYQTITGNANVPDLRGQVLRGKNNSRADGQQDPAGEIALGTQQADAMQGHNHQQNGVIWGNGATGNPPTYVSGGTVGANSGNPTSSPWTVTTPITDGSNGTPRIQSETRVKSVIVNHFIRIN